MSVLFTPVPRQLTFVLSAGDTGGYNPVDATAFYIGLSVGIITADPTTTAPTAAGAGWPSIYTPCTIREVYLTIVTGDIAGTAETGTGYIRVNNGTDNTVFNNTLKWDAFANSYSATALSIALTAGDFFSFKILPPTWATNPTVTFYAIQVVVSFP